MVKKVTTQGKKKKKLNLRASQMTLPAYWQPTDEETHVDGVPSGADDSEEDYGTLKERLKLVKAYRVSYHDELRDRWVVIDDFDTKEAGVEFMTGGGAIDDGYVDSPLKIEVIYTWTTPT